MPTVDRDGVGIHYDAGGSGPAILVTHGFAASSHMFDATSTALLDAHRVIAWDIRGHGRSDSPIEETEYSVALATGDMVAILDALDVDQAVLVGHSLGGYLSLDFQRAHPDRVTALVLVGTGPGYKRPNARDEWNRLAERYAVALETKGLAGLPDSVEMRADVHRTADGLVKAARGILRQHDDRVLANLPNITVPVLIVVGERDEPFLASSEYMRAKIPGASLAVIRGAGHAPMITHPDEFHARVRTFIDRLIREERPT